MVNQPKCYRYEYVNIQKQMQTSAFNEWLRVKKEQKKKEEKLKELKETQEEETKDVRKVHSKKQCERAFRRSGFLETLFLIFVMQQNMYNISDKTM